MKEIYGDLWEYYDKPNHIICITTNGTVKKNGCGVMGRGCAKELLERVPDADILLGSHLQSFGNNIGILCVDDQKQIRVIVFPVKHNWWEKADLTLIRKSAEQLNLIAITRADEAYILPRPGCGNGHLNWGEVKPLLEDLPDNVLVITR